MMKTKHRGNLILLLAAWAIPAGALCAADEPEGPQPELTDAQRQQLLELPKQYRFSKTFAERQAAVAAALELRPLGPQRIRSHVLKDVENAGNAYGAALQAAALRAERIELAGLLQDESLQQLRERAREFASLADQLAEAGGPSPAPKLSEQLEKREQELVASVREARALRSLDAQEAAAIEATNRERRERGLSPLEVDLRLCAAAAEHSADMTRHDFFSHTSPLAGKKTFGDRARRAGTRASAENIAVAPSGAQAVRSWMNSDGHRRNLLNPAHRRIGLGRSGRNYTQMFGR